MDLFYPLKRWWYARKLKNEQFGFLFDEPPIGEYVSIDCETTGLDTKKDEILSIGAVRIKNNVLLTSEALHLLVRPERSISVESIKVHHLRHCDLQGAMGLNEALERLLRFIGSRPLVGYYLEFDTAMIAKGVKPLLGIPLPNRQIEVSALYHDYKVEPIPQAFIDLRFDTIVKELKLPSLGKHSALNDAIMAALIFTKLNHLKKRR